MDLAEMRPRSPVTNNCGHLSDPALTGTGAGR
jgi:hypothetical protein